MDETNNQVQSAPKKDKKTADSPVKEYKVLTKFPGLKYFFSKIENTSSNKNFLLGIRNMDKNYREREKAREYYMQFVPKKEDGSPIVLFNGISTDDILATIGAAYATHVYKTGKRNGTNSFPMAMIAYKRAFPERADRDMRNILSFDVKMSFKYMQRHNVLKRLGECGLDFLSALNDIVYFDRLVQQRWSKIYWGYESEEDLDND